MRGSIRLGPGDELLGRAVEDDGRRLTEPGFLEPMLMPSRDGRVETVVGRVDTGCERGIGT